MKRLIMMALALIAWPVAAQTVGDVVPTQKGISWMPAGRKPVNLSPCPVKGLDDATCKRIYSGAGSYVPSPTPLRDRVEELERRVRRLESERGE